MTFFSNTSVNADALDAADQPAPVPAEDANADAEAMQGWFCEIMRLLFWDRTDVIYRIERSPKQLYRKETCHSSFITEVSCVSRNLPNHYSLSGPALVGAKVNSPLISMIEDAVAGIFPAY